jgi:hypothetical protein
MRVLETLARVATAKESALIPLIQQQRYQLGWGTTLIVITGMPNDTLIEELYQVRRAGQNALLILAGKDTTTEITDRRAKTFGIPVISIAAERDLQIWLQGSHAV